MSEREAMLLDMGLDPNDFAESKIDPSLFVLADWPNTFKDADYPCVPCAMCGHMCRWIVGFKHLPSGEIIYVGEDCADYLDSDNVVEKQMKQFKTKIANEKKKQEEVEAKTKRYQEFVKDHADVVLFLDQTLAQEVQYREGVKGVKAPLPFMNEMVYAFNKYGSLTENQTNAVRKIMVKQAEWEARKEAEKPAVALKGGKRLCEGNVVSIKLDSYYGTSTWKMLVNLIDGNRVWGSIPKSIRASVEHMRDLEGQKVSFFANVIVSPNDENFGFFKNPQRGVVERAI